MARPLRDTVEEMRQDVDLTGQRELHRLLLLLVDQVGEVDPLPDERGIEIGKRFLVGAIDKEAIDGDHGIVAAGAADGPSGGERLAVRQDLFDVEDQLPQLWRQRALSRELVE